MPQELLGGRKRKGERERERERWMLKESSVLQRFSSLKLIG